MTVSDDLSARIARLIEEYPLTDAPLELRKLATDENVLPLCCDIGGVFTISANGEIRSFLWDDTLHGQIEFDRRIRNVALFQGSRKCPELEVLIEKPVDARVCEYYDGSGVAPYTRALNYENIICYCGGLGWLP